MKSLRIISFILPLFLEATATSLHAQDKPRVSPHETVTANIDGSEITVVYGRPYTKDPKTGEKRTIWGGVVPYGKPWRMGADEATVLTVKESIELGGTKLAAGSYSLFMMPEGKGVSKLIVNKQTGQWGTKYDEKQDQARINLKSEKADKAVDQFTISIEKTDAGGGILKMAWEETEFWVPFQIKK